MNRYCSAKAYLAFESDAHGPPITAEFGLELLPARLFLFAFFFASVMGSKVAGSAERVGDRDFKSMLESPGGHVMKHERTIISATVLLISLALLAGTSSGGTIFIPVSGEDAITVTDPGDTWIDSDGVTHFRGMTLSTVLSGEDINGVPISGIGHYEVNANVDYATGDGDMTVHGSLVMNYGELAGSWRILFTSIITGFVHDGEFNAARGYDDFARWHMRGTWTGTWGPPDVNFFDGYFQIPGGGKAAATEAETWSGVKGLFR